MSSGSRIGVRVLISISVYAVVAGVDAQSANQNGGMDLFSARRTVEHGRPGGTSSEDRVEHPRVRVLTRNNEWVPAMGPMHFDKPTPIAAVGPGRAFGVAIAGSDPAIQVGLIPTAVGGSPVTAWELFTGVLYAEAGLALLHGTTPCGARERRCLPGTVKAILWHQGESDANPTNAPLYEQRLRTLIARFRAELGNPSLPFLSSVSSAVSPDGPGMSRSNR